MLSLSKEEILFIKENRKGIISYNGKKYYFKPDYQYALEIVCERIAKLLELKCAEYERIQIDDNYYLVSKDIGQNYDFKTALIVGIDHRNLYFVWDFLENNCPPAKVQSLMFEVVKMYLYDILILNVDRTNSNWGFICDGKKIIDMAILDNENSFTMVKSVDFDAKLYPDDKLQSDSVVSVKDAKMQANLENLEYFLEISSIEYINLFREMFAKLTPQVVEDIFADVEKEYGINPLKNFLLDIYARNYEAIKSILKQRCK